MREMAIPIVTHKQLAPTRDNLSVNNDVIVQLGQHRGSKTRAVKTALKIYK
uniref:Uncharacterized protein n=1 Tax=Tetranychus urticae TaxID=32264 RepID=T1K4X7_TETUR